MTCAVAIYICVFFYATSKFLIYCFLSESIRVATRAHLSHLVQSKRFMSLVSDSWLKATTLEIYMTAATIVGAYVAVILTMIIGKVTFLREHDQVCIIGLKRYSTIMLLTYSAQNDRLTLFNRYINVFLTSLFLYPLLRCNMNPCAACVALTTSTVNMVVLTIMKGHQLGWVCLGSCGTDVVFNALALFWVTRSGDVRVQNIQGCITSTERDFLQTIDLDISAGNVSLDRSGLASPKSGGTAFSSSISNSMYYFLPPTPSKVHFGSLGPPSQFEESICSYKNPESIFRVMTQGVTRPISEVHAVQLAVENEDEIQEVQRGFIVTSVRSSAAQDVDNERASP
ncbi:hypothetical protein BDZ89DRAFT_1087484 [Hymenopellis radicata]|nr:hypothetical protein BDZ89DRAFT_1087484 [Hymenopellis radicata]